MGIRQGSWVLSIEDIEKLNEKRGGTCYDLSSVIVSLLQRYSSDGQSSFK